jgi:SAM-dependent methyltransferase
MTTTVPDLGAYWATELASLREYRERAVRATYPEWQPTKWQSLRGLLDTVLAHCAAQDAPPQSAVELGCGSATISILLAQRGLTVTSVDKIPEALELARECCEGLELPSLPNFVLSDFCTRHAPKPVDSADLVLSGGVIEHWDVDGQRVVLQMHLDLSERWVLLTVPNLESPVFQSFLRWAEASGRLYEDEHYDISIPDLAEYVGCEVAVVDGCRIFLPQIDHYVPGDSELDDFCAELRSRLVEAGGSRYASFPQICFTSEDIDVLKAVEDAATTAERMRFGFLHYYLLDSQPATAGKSVRTSPPEAVTLATSTSPDD